jgi:HSP20 family protein
MSQDDLRSWMWNEALVMIERAEQIHRKFFEPGFPEIETSCWEPPVDIFESERELWIVAAVPGVDLNDLHVLAEDGMIRITGQRRIPAVARDFAIHRLEIPHGRFERRIRFPNRRLRLDRSELVNGCLTIRFAKLD